MKVLPVPETPAMSTGRPHGGYSSATRICDTAEARLRS